MLLVAATTSHSSADEVKRVGFHTIDLHSFLPGRRLEERTKGFLGWGQTPTSRGVDGCWNASSA